MIPNFTRRTGLFWCGWLLFAATAYSQEQPKPFAEKAVRSKEPLNTRSLNAQPIDGRRTQANARSGNETPWPRLTLPGLPLNDNPLAGVQIMRSAQTGLPIYIEGKIPNSEQLSRNGRMDARGAALSYLEALKSELQIAEPAQEFTLHDTHTDALNQSHMRMKQMYRGLEVYGAEVVLHGKNGVIHSLNGRYFPTPELEVAPKVSRERAVQAAITDLSAKTLVTEMSAPLKRLLEYDQPEARLLIYHPDRNPNDARLTWHITVRPNFREVYTYFVDARTAAVIHSINNTCHVDGPRTATGKDLHGANQTIHTYQAGNNYFVIDASRPMFNAAQSRFPDKAVGVIETLDARNTYGKNFAAYYITSTNNSWNSPVAVSAHTNSGKAFEYFKNVHGRNSIDGKGGSILSVINVADDDGRGMDNAYWNGKAMFYGNGDVAFTPLAGSLDVAGHEMSHGVVEHSANLEYQGQSGAINESFADIFGAMMDPEDWKIGEDVVKRAYFPSGALRDLSDPHNGGSSLDDNGYQPKHMSEYYAGTDDNGGVHINSGIVNYAYYLIATNIGRSKSEKIYYRALTTYLTATSQFIDLRIAVVKSAADLHGENSAEVSAVKNAFDAVGIFETPGNGQTPGELPTNTGDDFILIHDAGVSDPNSFYVYSPKDNSLIVRSTTRALTRPSVTDGGENAYFIASDRTIKYLSLQGNASEGTSQDEPIWNSVAVSKDGKKLAAVTYDADTSIWVFSFERKKWAKFTLYNPTYSPGVDAGGVLFADAIEWDYTGEYLVYDAYNEINKATGAPISYWDVGVIRVWDNGKNDFGDGRINKLFPSLPEGVSIGNPSFSKNSPYIAAFDYMEESTDTYRVISANFETGKVGIITENNTLGFPTFSKLDDKMAYTTLVGSDTMINVISLNADKLGATGAATSILFESKWAVWYAVGDRPLLSDKKDITAFSIAGLNAPAAGTITGDKIAVTVAADVDVTNLIATFTHSPLSTVKVGNTEQVSGATQNNFTAPVKYTVIAQDGSTKQYTVTVAKGSPTGIGDDNDVSKHFTLFPNPNNGRFTLQWSELEMGAMQVEVFNSLGMRVYERQFGVRQQGPKIELEVNGLPFGVYTVQVHIGSKTAYKRMVVR